MRHSVDMDVGTEESFGPIVPVSTIKSEEEALALIDASPYGLLASVFTEDLRRGLRFAEAARTGWVLDESSNYWESHLPFGGRAGSRTGIGRVRGRHPFDTFTETKIVIVGF
jgi:succinate-semialdehyde dehydrogenase/glutarate-semialdehyde dehydrogenase